MGEDGTLIPKLHYDSGFAGPQYETEGFMLHVSPFFALRRSPGGNAKGAFEGSTPTNLIHLIQKIALKYIWPARYYLPHSLCNF